MSSTLNIYVKPLDIREAKAVYIGNAHQDFPQNELKSFSMIEDLWNKGFYRGYGFYENVGESAETGSAEVRSAEATAGKDILRGYAFTMADPDAHILLVDYFAVCEEARGKGYGGKALALLKESCTEWDGIIFEVEDDESAESEEERLLRQRRISFYEKNGVEMTKDRSYAFGVDYKLMVLPVTDEKAGEGVGEKLSSIYQKMLSEQIFQTMFRLR
ncbi:MAG: hypothetical protein J6B68_03740 [Lachnospiraceae bacterium]|nr:hypothetical protein [Lachnospiraceae bacterium]